MERTRQEILELDSDDVGRKRTVAVLLPDQRLQHEENLWNCATPQRVVTNHGERTKFWSTEPEWKTYKPDIT